MELSVFALKASRPLGEEIAGHLGIGLGPHEERNFEDGEHKTRPLTSVRGRDVFVVQSLYGDAAESVNDKLCRLLFFLGALRDASAARITAVLPYLCYGRKDRQTKSRDPVTTRYVAALFEAVKLDRVVTLDVHNLAAFQNAFRIPSDHLEAASLFVDHFAPWASTRELVVVSPDAGGVKRAEAFRKMMEKALGRELDNAFIEKYRSAGVISGHAVVGDVDGKTAIIIDDMISSGATMVRAADACRARGATAAYAAATHGLLSGKARETLAHPSVDGIVVTNSVSPSPTGKVSVISVAGLLAEAIRRIHTDGSVEELRSRWY
ncbi:MAG TPA: ribose-phosphate pyrophosphokinase [Terriglobia bacterium]|nr:ribose-phosphate pyrophosphokinase [Terriglobia bacterium]